MPIALGRACKLTGFFLGHDKEYIGILHVHGDISLEELQKEINKNFIGKIKQLPPRKSRVKREERERVVESFKLLEQDGKKFLFQTKVQGGTYIRKLISDLGEKIGLGAHMLELRRIKAGIFSEEHSVDLYKFKQAVEEFKKGNEKKLREMLIPAEQAIKQVMPIVQAKSGSIKNLLTGKPIFKNDLEKLPKEEQFAVFFKHRFIEIAHKVNEKDIIARPEFVFN